MKTCPSCGKEIGEENGSCPACGQETSDRSPHRSRTGGRKKIIWDLGLILACPTAFFIVLNILLKLADNSPPCCGREYSRDDYVIMLAFSLAGGLASFIVPFGEWEKNPRL
jgi:hypothetical protein